MKALLGVLVSQPVVPLQPLSIPVHLYPPSSPSRVIHSGPECLPLLPLIGKHHTPSNEKIMRGPDFLFGFYLF